MEITRDIIRELIKTKNIAWQHPVNLCKGVIPIKSIQHMNRIITDNMDEGDTFGQEFFTYWDLNKNKPLFDIIATYDEQNPTSLYTYELSECSLFGMYLLNDGTLPTGMENVIYMLKLDVPPGLDYVKYAKANYKMALGDTDFV